MAPALRAGEPGTQAAAVHVRIGITDYPYRGRRVAGSLPAKPVLGSGLAGLKTHPAVLSSRSSEAAPTLLVGCVPGPLTTARVVPRERGQGKPATLAEHQGGVHGN